MYVKGLFELIVYASDKTLTKRLTNWDFENWISQSGQTKPHVLSWKFFQVPIENVLKALWTRLKYLRGMFYLVLCATKQ